MSDHLPDDLVAKILERLPVKSLIRCSLVCKSWYSVIRDPSFITRHLNRVNSPDETDKTFFTAYVADGRKIGIYSLSCDNSWYNHLKLDVSHGSALWNVEIVGTCSGLVFLKLSVRKEVDRMVIWNPCIRKSVSILSTQSSLHRAMFYGFCVHPTTHEYKVLAFHYGGVEIYRQHTGAWTAINCVVPPLLDHVCYPQVCVNGVVYWHQVDGSDSSNSIALFNMHTEAFSEVTLPPSLVHAEPARLDLAFSSKYLLLCQELDACCYDIWVLKEYGVSETWCKLFNVQVPFDFLAPSGLRMNGELLLITPEVTSLVSLDPITNRTTTIAIEGSQTGYLIADTYVESLLLLNANAANDHDSFGEFLSE